MTPVEFHIISSTIDAFERPTFRRRLAAYVAVPFGVFLAAFLASLRAGISNGVAGTRGGPAAVIPGADMTAWEIFQNNLLVLSGILVGGVLTFAVGTFLVLVANGLHFGSGIGFLLGSYGERATVAAFVPHGVFEVAAFLVAASVALRVSVLLVAWRVRGPDTGFTRRTALELSALVVLSVILLAVAAVIETTVTAALVSRVG